MGRLVADAGIRVETVSAVMVVMLLCVAMG